MNLSKLQPGENCIVQTVHGEGALRRRLLEMGLTPGTLISVQKLAPAGDPMEICLRGYHLTLRKEDAAKIDVERSGREAVCPILRESEDMHA